MKSFIAIILCIVVVGGFFSLVGCSANSALKFGVGIYVGTPTETSATREVNGSGKVELTFAAVLLNQEGAIVSCSLDSAEHTVKFDSTGKAIANESFQTKKEAGTNYGMVAYGGAAKEWYEQASAFEGVVVGKTLQQVKDLLTADNKGTQEVINAGCTITVNGFVAAIEKACNQAEESNVTAKDLVKITTATKQTLANATQEKNGENTVSTTVFAAALNQQGKVAAAYSDCVEIAFPFTIKGESALDSSQKILTKREAGSNYGMVAYGGATKEWFQQADVFDAACVGKTPNEIGGLQGENGKGTQELITAGCTINITDFVKAAQKIES